MTKLELSNTAWSTLLDFLFDRGVLEDYDDVYTDYTGRGEMHDGFGFTLDSDISAQLRFGAAIAEAWMEVDDLIEMAADGYGAHDFLRDARLDSMGRGTIIYFPGHKAPKA